MRNNSKDRLMGNGSEGQYTCSLSSGQEMEYPLKAQPTANIFMTPSLIKKFMLNNIASNITIEILPVNR